MQLKSLLNLSKLIRLNLILVFSLFIFSCKPNNQNELYGKYSADYDIANEELVLNSDRTFLQKVEIKKTSQIDIVRGNWKYDPSDGYITFYDSFMTVTDGFGKLRPEYKGEKTGLVSMPADRFFWNIYIGTDEGVLYKKIE